MGGQKSDAALHPFGADREEQMKNGGRLLHSLLIKIPTQGGPSQPYVPLSPLIVIRLRCGQSSYIVQSPAHSLSLSPSHPHGHIQCDTQAAQRQAGGTPYICQVPQ